MNLASYEGNSGEITDATGEYSMSVNAEEDGAKFSPRESNGDTQVNAGTILSFDVAESSDGATVTVNLSGGNTTFTVQIDGDSQEVATADRTASFDVPAEGGTVSITFSASAYLSSIVVAFNTSFPESAPTDVTAADTTWSSSSFTDTIEGETGEWDGIMVDASSGESSKFAKNDDSGYIQINTPVTLYVPLAASDQPATLSLSFHNDNIANAEITVDNVTLTGDDSNTYTTTLDASGVARWVEVDINAVDESSSVTIYLGSIELDYASDTDSDTDTDESEDYPGVSSNVTAEDTVWDLTTGDASLDTEGGKNEWDGILIDASASGAKFSSNNGDKRVQVKSGTVIYIPVAASEEDAILRLSGTAAAGMTVTIDGTDSDVNTDVIVDASDTSRYVTVEFGSTEEAGSNAAIYLTSISVDYLEDDEQTYHIVTVGAGESCDGESCDYQTITDALNKETSSLKDRLVLSIAPGDYEEQIHVTQPGVVFQNASYTNDDGTYTYTGEVIIHESKYSSNTWNEDGEYVPNDENDLGTSECGTVIIDQTATGFSAYGITFQNDYNVVDNTKSGTQTPAVAFDSKADKVNLSDCKFIGRQDTLYVEGSGNRVYVSDSYIEGSVDFIFGDADAYFTDCDIHMAAFADRTSGYYTAPNTKEGHVGLVFYNCELTADDQYTGGVSLGRPWQTLCKYDTEIFDAEGNSRYTDIQCDTKNSEYSNVSSAATFIGSTMPSSKQLVASRWSLWTHRNEDGNMVNVTYVDDVRFAEISTYNPDHTKVTEEDQLGDFVVGNVSYEGSSFVTIDSEADPDEAAANMLDEMCIGSSFGWDPANMTITDPDDGSAEPTDPTGPDGSDETGGNSGDGSDGSGSTTDGGDTSGSGSGTESGDTTDSGDTGNTSGNSGSGSGSTSGSGSSSSAGGSDDTISGGSAGSGSSASGSGNSGSGDETGGSSGSSTSANADGSNDSSTSDNGTSDADDSDSDGLSSLSQTGSAVAGVAVAAVILVAAGVIAMVARRRTATGRHSHAR